MKKALFVLVCVLTMIFVSCGSTGDINVSVKKGSLEEAKTTLSSDNMTDIVKITDSKAGEVCAAIRAIYEGIGKTEIEFPKIGSDDWSIYKTEKDGVVFYSGLVTAKAKSGNNFIVSGWFEDAGDHNFIVHYLDCKDGVLFDDGVIED